MTGYTEAQAIGDVAEQIRNLSQSLDSIAYEQHTANLIALLASEGAWSHIGHVRADVLTARIVERLGLGS